MSPRETYGTFSTAYVEAMRLRLSALEAENKDLRGRLSDADTERNAAQGALKAAFDRVVELEARCKRLEEAGGMLEWRIACGCGQGGPCRHCADTLEAWQQAKEAKP